MSFVSGNISQLVRRYPALNIPIKPRGGGAYSKLNYQERGLFLEGGLIREGGAYSKIRKIRCKRPKKRLEVLKNELDNELDIGVIMQKMF